MQAACEGNLSVSHFGHARVRFGSPDLLHHEAEVRRFTWDGHAQDPSRQPAMTADQKWRCSVSWIIGTEGKLCVTAHRKRKRQAMTISASTLIGLTSRCRVQAFTISDCTYLEHVVFTRLRILAYCLQKLVHPFFRLYVTKYRKFLNLLKWNLPFVGALAKLRKATISLPCLSVSPSVCRHATTRIPLDGFSWNLILGYFFNLSSKFELH